MREIKFRGIRERNVREKKEMLYGKLNNIYPGNPFIWPSPGRGYAVRPETVGQFTGLHDKNGREIYEGDVYHQGDPKITYTVVWADTGLKGKQNGSSSYAGLSHWADRIEVIGNIHEHPHLLEQANE